MKSKIPLQKLTKLALLTAVSLMIYVLESLLPPIVPIPGIKLGLANIITLITLACFDLKEATLVLLCRILLAGFFFGQALSLLYSLAGGFCCLLIMSLFHRLLSKGYLPITSVMGALSHNIAQLLVALAVTGVPGILAYLPFLLISAIITGTFTGLCAHFTLKALPGQLR